ncbi:MAG: hypothetical protein K6A44_06590 [bacterium]|nr:hypothetical protein [bacterium]
MNSILEKDFQFATNFFNNAIKKDKLFHSYLLTGNNNAAKYAFALNIARILNCTGDKSEDCSCLNCKWIRNNSHPAVMTFSPIDFIHVNDGGKAKDNISVNQARFIKEELNKTSTYHRVLIITDAIEGKEAEEGYLELKKYGIKAPLEAGSTDETERIWAPKSLSVNIFSTETANALLKTIEEPFENVTFFFLANSKEDLIQTIVSRCQCVNVPSSPNKAKDYSIIEKITKNFPAKDNLTAVMMADCVKNISKENDISIQEVLELIENYYGENISNNLGNTKNYRTILTFLNKLEIAKSQIERYVNPDSALEILFFNEKI